LSVGRLTLSVCGGVTLFPPLEVFDAVILVVRRKWVTCSVFTGKVKRQRLSFFTGLPFGFTAQGDQTLGFTTVGGLKLWEENLRPV